MDWSFRALLVFAAAFAVVAADHYLLDERLTGALAALVGALTG